MNTVAAYSFKTSQHYKDKIYECIDKLNALGIPISNRIAFKTTTGFSKFGFCKRTPKDLLDFTIAINKWFEDDLALEETIMHELVHTVDGCYNHGAKFHDIADMINEAYNLNITVIGNYKLNEKAYKNKGSKRKVFEVKDFDENTMMIMYCPTCKQEFAIRKTAIKRGHRWVCKKCRKVLLFK